MNNQDYRRLDDDDLGLAGGASFIRAVDSVTKSKLFGALIKMASAVVPIVIQNAQEKGFSAGTKAELPKGL